MTLVKIEGKSLEKLIDVVSKGIGTLYKPRAIRKEADAEAYKAEVLAKADAKKTLIEGDAKVQLYQRVQERLRSQEVNRQINIEEVVEKSIEHLEENPSEEPVEADWRTRFFKKAQDVSNEEMQEVWAKILAGEIIKPGTVSLRTLEVVSNTSKKEAEIFQTACSLSSNDAQIYKLSQNSAFDDFGLTYNHLMILRDAGLIHDNDSIHSVLKVVPELEGSVAAIGKEIYIVKNPTKSTAKEFQFPQVSFTTAGKEICSLLKVQKNEKYFEKLFSEKEKEKYEFTKINLATQQ